MTHKRWSLCIFILKQNLTNTINYHMFFLKSILSTSCTENLPHSLLSSNSRLFTSSVFSMPFSKAILTKRWIWLFAFFFFFTLLPIFTAAGRTGISPMVCVSLAHCYEILRRDFCIFIIICSAQLYKALCIVWFCILLEKIVWVCLHVSKAQFFKVMMPRLSWANIYQHSIR